MESGYRAGELPSGATASPPVRLRPNDTAKVWARVEIYAPEGVDGVSGNTEAVWLGGEYTSAAGDVAAGVPLHPGDAYEFQSVRLYDIWLSVTVDGDRVTWVAFD